jgi:hypothetical protein
MFRDTGAIKNGLGEDKFKNKIDSPEKGDETNKFIAGFLTFINKRSDKFSEFRKS